MRIEDADFNDTEMMKFIGMQQSQKVQWGGHYAERLLALRNLENTGAVLPWSKTHNDIQFRPGELSLWCGINGHKKSMLLGQVLLWIAKTQKVGIMSFELPVEKTMSRLSRQAAGCDPSEGFQQDFACWNNDRICYYDQMDSVPPQKILGVIYHMANNLGCQHIAIDSLMMVRLKKSDDERERRFVEVLAAAAKALAIHVHLVHHMRKPPDSKGQAYVPNKFDCRGDSGVVDKADNLYIVWENKRRRALKVKVKNGIFLDDKDQKYFQDTPDQLLICEKQRFGEYEGRVGLWFHDESLQFLGTESTFSMPFDIHNSEAE